ncbi:MAG: pentapeptide repeat-containing protein [Stenomitos frigidus ULC029]
MKQPAWQSRKVFTKGAAVLVGSGAAIALLYSVQAGNIKTGFEPDETITKTEKKNKQGDIIETTSTIAFQDAKTLWDWLSLLGVPFSLAVLGYVLQQLQQKRIDEQVKVEKEIAESNQREEALQNYLDRLSELLIDKNMLAIADRVQEQMNQGFVPVKSHGMTIQTPIESHEATGQEIELVNAAKDVIRARTLSILRRLGQDGARKGDVLQFLIEAEVINKLKLNLSGANLSGMSLRDTKLRSVYLRETDLSSTNLYCVDFRYANLSSVNLSSANLSPVDFCNVDLSNANLRNTNFTKEVRLFSANLSNADLRDAQGWSEEQLSAAKLCQTKLPKGCNLDPNRDCEALGILPS